MLALIPVHREAKAKVLQIMVSLDRVRRPSLKILKTGAWRWHTPLFPVLGRQRQANLSEFAEASLVYRASSRLAMTVTQRNPVSKKNKNKTKQ